MKQKMILMAAACVLLSAIAAFAQTGSDFSGDWVLDVSKSKVNNIESGTLKVTQTGKEFTYTMDLKRAPRPEGAGGGMGPGGMGRGGGMGMGGNQMMTYSLEGKETSVEMPGPQGNSTAKLKAQWNGGKLKLTSKRNLNTQMGEVTVTTKETWEIVDGGNALKVTREMETPRGAQTSEMYFTKK